MNLRQMMAAWVMALALVGGLTLGPVMLRERAEARTRSDIVAIGSSLTAYAVPEVGGGAASLLGDGRSHRRFAALRISERELLARLERAIEQRPAIILVEINPLLVDFADRPYQRSCDGWAFAARSRLAELQWRVIDAYRALRSRPPLDVYSGDPINIGAAHMVNLAEARRVYPLVLRDPCDTPRLEAAVAWAKQLGIRVALMLPPRSPDGERMLGPEVTRELASRADAFARRLDVPLFAPRGDWRNDEFIDLAHMNRAGRAHFQQDLRRWWAYAQ